MADADFFEGMGVFFLQAQYLLLKFFTMQKMRRLKNNLLIAFFLQLFQHGFGVINFDAAFSKTFADNYRSKCAEMVIGRKGSGKRLLNTADVMSTGFVKGGTKADNHHSFFVVHFWHLVF